MNRVLRRFGLFLIVLVGVSLEQVSDDNHRA